jgi:EAL domain-containing protein (putative c-di-GMP-specific phosphodiesterase class I)
VSQFRLYNTLYGWAAGVQLLKAIAQVLKQEIDASDELFSRTQGDRFLLMLVDHGTEEQLSKRLERICELLEHEIFALTNDHMSIKMGVCRIVPGSGDIRMALGDALQAMESLRDVNKSAIRVYDKELEHELREMHLHDMILESAGIWENFETFYQPKVDIRTGDVVGAEAVARFHDPTENGAIRSPDYFVPYYEKTGKVVELDFFIMENVCRMIRERLDQGKEAVTVSCNFSRRHFLDPEFPNRFMKVVEKYQIPLELIEAEITETMAVEELQYRQIQRTIQVMHERGVRLSIDDFGSGYSSLGVLEQIPASVIKLDRSFLLNKEDRERQINIMKSIVKLADKLGAEIVCEGIETEDDVSLMYEIGAYVAQGYRYGHPMPEGEFLKRLK